MYVGLLISKSCRRVLCTWEKRDTKQCKAKKVVILDAHGERKKEEEEKKFETKTTAPLPSLPSSSPTKHTLHTHCRCRHPYINIYTLHVPHVICYRELSVETQLWSLSLYACVCCIYFYIYPCLLSFFPTNTEKPRFLLLRLSVAFVQIYKYFCFWQLTAAAAATTAVLVLDIFLSFFCAHSVVMQYTL